MRRLTDRLTGYAEKISAALFALMLGAFMVQIVSRYLLNDPVSWSLELCSVGYVWVVFFAGLATRRLTVWQDSAGGFLAALSSVR